MRTGFILVLALLMGGCDTRYTVREEDREGMDIQRQALEAQDPELVRIEEALNESPDLKTTAIMPIVERMREKNEDAKKINAQLLANLGAPKVPKVYSHAEVQSLIERMAKSHSGGWLASLGAGLLAGATFVIGLARSPFAKMIPGVGTILSSLDSTMAAVETWMQKMKDGGKPELAGGLAAVMQAAHTNPAISKYIEAKLGKIKAGAFTMPPEAQVASALAADEAVATAGGTTA